MVIEEYKDEGLQYFQTFSIYKMKVVVDKKFEMFLYCIT